MPHKSIIDDIVGWLYYGWLWIIWWIAVYLNQIRKWASFKYSMLAINIFLAWWIWWLSWASIPETVSFKNSLVSISWFLAYPILDILEERWVNLLIEKYLWKKGK